MTQTAENDGGAAGGPQQFRPPESSLRDYLRVVSTRRWLVISTFLVVVLLAGVWTFTRVPIYRSEARLQIEPGKPSIAPFRRVMGENPYLPGSNHDFLKTQLKLIVSERLVEQTYVHFGIGDKPRFRTDKDPLRKFKRLFGVSLVRGTWLVDVTFDWPDPKLGARILDYHVTQYVDDYARRKREMATQGLANLRRQREEYAPRVEEARRKLQAFKEQHNMIAFDQVHDTIADDLMARSGAVSMARQKLSELKTRLEQIEKAVRDKTPVENLPDVLRSEQIRDYRNEKLLCEQSLREGLKRFGENHPEIRALRAKLDSITENINLEITRILESVRTEAAAAEKLLALRLDELQEQETKVQAFNKLKLKYDALKSAFETQNQIYTAVMKRIDEIEIATNSNVKGETITIEKHPREETTPAKPRKMLIMALACILGLALGVGLAFLLDNLDTTLKSKECVSRYLGLNLLGYVPEIPELNGARRKHSRAALAMLRHPRSAAAEAFRSIRTALSFSVAAQDVNHIMVTSASPSEGKTLVSANIAAAIAQTGKSVLLVDADMRKPAVHKVFEVEQSPGLTNLLVGEGAGRLDDVILPTDIPNLFLLPCGPIPPNPAELIGCDRMMDLFEQLAQRYDRIIIDTPPVVNVTDAAVLCRTAHGVVLVIRSFRTQRDLARRAAEVLANSGGKLLGTVLNNIDVPRGAYYYDSYYYYQQYYYYAEDGTKRKKQKKRERDARKATA